MVARANILSVTFFFIVPFQFIMRIILRIDATLYKFKIDFISSLFIFPYQKYLSQFKMLCSKYTHE